MDYSIIEYNEVYTMLPTEKKIVSGTQGALFGQGALFDTISSKEYIVPIWVKKIISNIIRYDDILSSIFNAKNGRSTHLSINIMDAYYSYNSRPTVSNEVGLF